ncbi:MAG TPA: response regulator FixJ [Caulobacteraceae bacterium]|nr:response regulator FixJ [Caulobacteraceae bacterium]
MPEPVAHVIDDDDDARDSLAFLLSTDDIPVETYSSAQAFLKVAHDVDGVVVTDVRMPEMDGLELIRRLHAEGVRLPVVVMTGHGDVPLAVEAMKAGVLDFIEKPYDDEVMLGAVRAALARRGETQARDSERAEFLRRFDLLSPRERQVMEGLVAGKANKVIAFDLDISQRTVEIYRAHVMTKTQAHSLSELVRMAMVAGLT